MQKKSLITCLVLGTLSVQAFGDVESLKLKILNLANSYQGQGDPDLSKQKNLDILVNELLREQPQTPVRDRLNFLYGTWKQVWGPYSYGNNSRGVDPSLDPKNIYQVIFQDGYYYNVNPKLNNDEKPVETRLLRGEFELDPSQENNLNVRFTDYRKIMGLPQDGIKLWELPALSESKQLRDEKLVLPPFLVRLLLRGWIIA